MNESRSDTFKGRSNPPASGYRAIQARRVLRLVALVVVGLTGLIILALRYWPETYLHAAQAGMDRRDYVAARAALVRYLAARPDSATAHLLLAQLERRSDNYEQAARELDACRRSGGSPDAIELERALALIQRGVYTTDLYALCSRHLAQKDADEYVILEAVSQGLTKTYRLKEALLCLNRLLSLQPDSTYALRRRAWVYSQLEQHELEEADYRRALAIDPEDQVAGLGLAHILITFHKDYSEAAEHFERLWQVRPDGTVAAGLGRGWRLAGRTDDARRFLDDWLGAHPADPQALAERGELAAAEQKNEEAVDFLRRAVAVAPYLFDSYYTLYLCLTRLGRTAEASESQARMEKAKAEFKQTKEELGRLTAQLQAAPDDADARCRMAQIFLRYGEEEGVRWLLLNIENQPNHRPSHLALADYYDRQGQKALATEHRRLAR
jgi:tetratricopeptide (TPR) repeat protein